MLNVRRQVICATLLALVVAPPPRLPPWTCSPASASSPSPGKWRARARARERPAPGCRQRARRSFRELGVPRADPGRRVLRARAGRGDHRRDGAPLRGSSAAVVLQSQTLVEGLQYIHDARRDAARGHGSPAARQLARARAPFPTLVEYSGYAAADPDNPQPSTLLAQRARLRDRRRSTCAARVARAASSTSSTTRPPPTATTSSRRSRPAVGAGQQGRHDRHLVPRHQPALRRPARSRRTSPPSRRSR